MPPVSKYVREVFITLAELADEGNAAKLRADFTEDGSFESEVRMAALDGMILKMFPKDVFDMLNAMSAAGIEAQKAAHAIMIMGYKQGTIE